MLIDWFAPLTRSVTLTAADASCAVAASAGVPAAVAVSGTIAVPAAPAIRMKVRRSNPDVVGESGLSVMTASAAAWERRARLRASLS